MFELRWTEPASAHYADLKQAAEKNLNARRLSGKSKSSRAEGLFKQVHKALQLLGSNPQHPALHTHEYLSLENPYDANGKVWEAYAQNKTPGAYRIFWCYGPQ